MSQSEVLDTNFAVRCRIRPTPFTCMWEANSGGGGSHAVMAGHGEKGFAVF